MYRIDGYVIDDIEYLVIEDKDVCFSETALELLASRSLGVGADRVILADREQGCLLYVADKYGCCQKPSMEDLKLVQRHLAASGEGAYHFEVRLTDYFFQQLVTASTVCRTA